MTGAINYLNLGKKKKKKKELRCLRNSVRERTTELIPEVIPKLPKQETAYVISKEEEDGDVYDLQIRITVRSDLEISEVIHGDISTNLY